MVRNPVYVDVVHALAKSTPHGYQLLQLSGKTLKQKVVGFRSCDGDSAINDRKRLQDLIRRLRVSVGISEEGEKKKKAGSSGGGAGGGAGGGTKNKKKKKKGR
eukprot:g2643.t1